MKPVKSEMLYFEPLEKRILLSADVLPIPVDPGEGGAVVDADVPPVPIDETVAEGGAEPEAVSPENESPEATEQVAPVEVAVDRSDDQVDSDLQTDTPEVTGSDVPPPLVNSIVFVNDNISSPDQLTEIINDSGSGSDSQIVITLDSTTDGIELISSTLEEYSDVDAIHIFSHGAGNDDTGSVQLGSTWLTSENIEKFQNELNSWGNSLSENADILIYGCNIAETDGGKQFVDTVSEYTGADVAASDDATGNDLLGGDWLLEYAKGEIEAAPIVTADTAEDWVELLVEQTISDNFATGDYAGSNGSLPWIGDWVETGEATDESAGSIQVISNELRITTADKAGSEKSIVRGADISGASTVYLAFDYRATILDEAGTVSVQIKESGSGTWTTLETYTIDNNNDLSGKALFDITTHKSANTEVRFLTEGKDNGGTSDGVDQFYVDNVKFHYTTTSFQTYFWLSTSNDVTNGDQPGLDTWKAGDLIAIGDPNIAFEDGVDPNNVLTHGVVTMGASINAFVAGIDINAIHYVGSDIQVGSSNFQLYQGDLLLNAKGTVNYNGLLVNEKDVAVFHPDTPGNYSSGTFTMLLKNLANDRVTSLSLVEQDTTVGSVNLDAGDFIYTNNQSGQKNIIKVFNTIDVGATSTTGNVTTLLNGENSNVNINGINGLDIVESSVTIGGRTLNSGELVVSIREDQNVGNNSIEVKKYDAFVLSVAAGSSNAVASLFFEGEDLNFNSSDERVDGFSLVTTNSNSPPTATNLSFDETYTEEIDLNLTDIVVSDVNGNQVTTTLTLSDTGAGTFNTAVSGAVTSTFASGVWTASGDIADVNTLLAGLTFTPTLNYDQNFTIATSVSDGIAAPVTGVKNMTATPINDAPTAANLDTAEIYTVSSSLDLANIVVTDVDSATVTATLTLSDIAAGSLSTATSGLVTSTYNAGTGVWEASGVLADINTLLAGVTYNPNGAYALAFDIDTSIDDGTAVPITGTKNMTSVGGNAAPIATNLDAAETYTEDTSLDLMNIDITDDSSNVTARLTLSDTSAGTLSVDTVGSVTSFFNSATGVWEASGLLANVESLLAGVMFIPAMNYDSNFTMTTSISDGVAAAITGTKNFTAIPVDDDPTATNLNTAESYVEETPLNLTDIVVTDIDSANITATLTLSDVGAGVLTTATSNAVTSSFVGGVWTASGAKADVNTLLAGVSFNPNTDYSSDFTLTTSVTDVGPPITGSKNMIATGVNDAPAGTNRSGNLALTEDNVLDLPDIVVTDVDSTEVTASLTLSNSGAGAMNVGTAGTVTSTFSGGVWSASGALADVNTLLAGVAFTPTANFDSNFTIVTSIDDGEAAALLGNLDVTVTPVGDTPTVTSVVTDVATQSGLIFIARNSEDGPEVTHFRINGITNGQLYLADGVTSINNNDYLTVAQGTAGVRFTPSGLVNGSFTAESSEDGTSVAAQSGAALSVITVNVPPAVVAPVVPVDSVKPPVELPKVDPDPEPEPEPIEPDPIVDPVELAVGLAVEAIMPVEEAVTAEPTEPDVEEAADEEESTEEDATTLVAGGADSSERSEVITSNAPALTTADMAFDFVLRESVAKNMNLQEIRQVESAIRAVENEFIKNNLQMEMNKVLDLLYKKRSILETKMLTRALDYLQEEMSQEALLEKTVIGSAIAATTTLSAGYVIWLIRSGVLLSSLLSSMPAWQLADPLAVLSGRREEGEDDRDESLESIIKSGGQQQPDTHEEHANTHQDTN